MTAEVQTFLCAIQKPLVFVSGERQFEIYPEHQAQEFSKNDQAKNPRLTFPHEPTCVETGSNIPIDRRDDILTGSNVLCDLKYEINYVSINPRDQGYDRDIWNTKPCGRAPHTETESRPRNYRRSLRNIRNETSRRRAASVSCLSVDGTSVRHISSNRPKSSTYDIL